MSAAMGFVELTEEQRQPVIELEGAVLCEDCRGITKATKAGACGRCGSGAVDLIVNGIPAIEERRKEQEIG